MKRWMATLSFKQKPTPEVMALIPSEQAHVKELIQQKLLESIYISSAEGKVWLVLWGDNSEVAQTTLSSLPMHDYFNIQLEPLDT